MCVNGKDIQVVPPGERERDKMGRPRPLCKKKTCAVLRVHSVDKTGQQRPFFLLQARGFYCQKGNPSTSANQLALDIRRGNFIGSQLVPFVLQVLHLYTYSSFTSLNFPQLCCGASSSCRWRASSWPVRCPSRRRDRPPPTRAGTTTRTASKPTRSGPLGIAFTASRETSTSSTPRRSSSRCVLWPKETIET